MKVVVDCERWVRGRYKKYGRSCLLNEKGNRCCLGFVAKVLGYRDGSIQTLLAPAKILETRQSNVLCDVQETERGVFVRNSVFSAEAMGLNDYASIDDAERRRRLVVLGKEHGVEFEFINVPA
jgi:hypothetical protein